jgi:RimJ/RimL family protein N-acetyltransferase
VNSQIEFYVRPAEVYDALKICDSRNNGDRLFLKDPNLYSEEQTKRWLSNLPPTSMRLIVWTKPTTRELGFTQSVRIGVIRIDSIDRNNAVCEVGLDIFDDFKGQGLSVPIYTWLLNHLFDDMNFHSAYLEVLSSNKRAIHIYKKLGFRISGVQRERIYRNGKYEDYLYMDLLRSEWKNGKNSTD